jgi:16S rRNA (uracil1498-N3)-methyltransferase
MRRHRVLVEDLAAGEATLIGPEAHHLRDVLRVRPGDAVEAFDGRGSVATGEVLTADRDALRLRLTEPSPSTAEAAVRITLAVALLKGDKLSDVVRPATELGVAAFQLLTTRNVDVPAATPAKVARLQRVAAEATRQCGRAWVPEVRAPLPLERLAWEGACLVGDPDADASLADVVGPGSRAASEGAVTLVTGPEGGLDADEVALLVDRGAIAVRFGPRILRAQTAPVAFAAAMLFWNGG